MAFRFRFHNVLQVIYWSFIGFLLFVLLCNLHVFMVSKEHIYTNTTDLPYNEVGLVPGTSMYLKSGKLNPYFQYRMKAAAHLYFHKKVKYLLVSGDNRRMDYNEPVLMRKALIKLGVPSDHIIIDYAGFRTLDSVVRSKEVFGQNKISVISQKFQNRRAVFIARKSGIEAIAFNTKDVEHKSNFKIHLREIFARVKAVVDIYVLKTQPYFLGEPIIIE